MQARVYSSEQKQANMPKQDMQNTMKKGRRLVEKCAMSEEEEEEACKSTLKRHGNENLGTEPPSRNSCTVI